MNKEEIKIITLGDIFRNLETEEQAFEFLKYIKNLQQENQSLKKQLEEFINYMMNTIENITHDETDDEEIKGYLIQRGNTFKEILSKYKEIIGSDINVGSIGGKE